MVQLGGAQPSALQQRGDALGQSPDRGGWITFQHDPFSGQIVCAQRLQIAG
jgi:hypothetical protein